MKESHEHVQSQKKPHLTQYDGKQYDVHMLEAYADTLPTVQFSLGNQATVKDIVQNKYWRTPTGESIGPSDLLDEYDALGDWDLVLTAHPDWAVHVNKVKGVDYTRPALVYEGHLIDGIHRLTKALSEGAETFPVNILDTLPEDAEFIETS